MQGNIFGKLLNRTYM